MRLNLPRVTYTNYFVDFTPLHDYLDKTIPEFEREKIGRSFPNIIGGRDDSDGKAYKVSSPIDNNINLGEFISASPSAVDRAVAAAKQAFAEWGSLNWRERVFMLRRVAEELDVEKYNLGLAALLEVGKSRMEAIGETEECVDFIKYYCDEMDRNNGFQGDTSYAYPNEWSRFELKPYGVFAVISPFNFPVAMAVNMLCGVVLTGNTAVFKPSPNSGLTAYYLVRAFEKAGLPAGVVNLVCGHDETGAALADNPGIDGVVFTGSHNVGMGLYRKMSSGAHVRPCIVEMGGKNPSYVTSHADLEAAAQGVMRSAFAMGAQKCSANSKVYVQEEIYDAFLKRLKELTSQIKIGDPRGKETYLGPLVAEDSARRYEKYAEIAKQDGKIISGGSRLRGGIFDRGAYVEPLIVTNLPASHEINKTELFVPILSVQKFKSLENAIKDGNDVAYGLTAGFYSQNSREVEYFCTHQQSGVLYINRASGATTGTWPGVQTFTGWKGTGAGGKGGMGPFYLPQFMREQSQTRWFGAIAS